MHSPIFSLSLDLSLCLFFSPLFFIEREIFLQPLRMYRNLKSLGTERLKCGRLQQIFHSLQQTSHVRQGFKAHEAHKAPRHAVHVGQHTCLGVYSACSERTWARACAWHGRVRAQPQARAWAQMCTLLRTCLGLSMCSTCDPGRLRSRSCSLAKVHAVQEHRART